MRSARPDANSAGCGSPVGNRKLAELVAALSPRDLAILRSVAQLHLVTTRQLERLHFQGTGMTPLSAARVARRSLARLWHHGLLERLERRIGGERAGSAAQVWRMTPVGSRAVGRPTRNRMREPGLDHLAHTLAIADLVVRLYEHQRSAGLTVVRVETEPQCWRPYLSSRTRYAILKPDLRVTLAVGGWELHWFVEVDRATESSPVVVSKNNAYLAAWRGGGEEARAGVYPRVLWVVPDRRRAADVEAICAAAPSAPSGLFVVALDHQAVDALVTPPRPQVDD